MTPPRELGLWRYLKFTKFVSLISTGALWFARADTLGDPFEMSVPRWAPALTYNVESEQLGQMSPDMIDRVAEAFRSVRSWISVNCWFSGERDSAAMWARFGSQEDGVAVRSSVGQLIDAIDFDGRVYVGKVSYFDYDRADPPEGSAHIGWGNHLTLAFSKRDAFQYEQEVRAVLFGEENQHRSGVPVSVDLTMLIDEVTVAPFAEQWFVDLVERYLGERGIAVPVGRSQIGSEPNWRFAVHPSFEHLPVMGPNPPSDN